MKLLNARLGRDEWNWYCELVGASSSTLHIPGSGYLCCQSRHLTCQPSHCFLSTQTGKHPGLNPFLTPHKRPSPPELLSICSARPPQEPPTWSPHIPSYPFLPILHKAASVFITGTWASFFSAPEIHLLDIYPWEMKTYVHSKTCAWMFTVPLFTRAKERKQSKCPSANEWINKMW